jgi:hypothetical protein
MIKKGICCSFLSARLNLLTVSGLLIGMLAGFAPPVFADIPSSLSRFGPLLWRAITESKEKLPQWGLNLGLNGIERPIDSKVTTLLKKLPDGDRKMIAEALMNTNARKIITKGAGFHGMPSQAISFTYIALKLCVLEPKVCEEQGRLASGKLAQRKFIEYRYSEEYLKDCGGSLPIQSRRLSTGLSNNDQLPERYCRMIDEISRMILPSETRYRSFGQF